MLAWEPPHRLVVEWKVSGDPTTEIEVRFTPTAEGTRVELEHSGWRDEGHRGNYDKGWDFVLGRCQQPAISESGQIVGTVSKLKGATTVERAYVWQNGRMTDLGTLGGASSFAAAINDQGQVVGSSQTKSGSTHAVLWTLHNG